MIHDTLINIGYSEAEAEAEADAAVETFLLFARFCCHADWNPFRFD